MNREEKLQLFAEILKQNGFTVLVSKTHPFKWLHFEKGGKLGYVQENHYGGFDFSNVHKPSSQFGTSFGVVKEVELNLFYAEKALQVPYEFLYAIGKVENYKSVDEFINKPMNHWAKYYIY